MKGVELMKINTYGIKMNGLRKAAGKTKCLANCRDGCYVQISYDLDDGDIYTCFHCDVNSCIQYYGDVITVCNAKSPKTMQQIADKIAEVLGHENH